MTHAAATAAADEAAEAASTATAAAAALAGDVPTLLSVAGPAAAGRGHAGLVSALTAAFIGGGRSKTDIATNVAVGVAAAVGEGGGAPPSPALASALLAAWAAAAAPGSTVPPAARAVAASTFRALISTPTSSTRLAPRLAAGFGLTAADLSSGGGRGEAAATLLALASSGPAGAGPAAALLASLPGLGGRDDGGAGESAFDSAAIAALLAGGGEAAASAFAATRGPATPAPAALVDACLSSGRLRSAAAFVRRFRLRTAYPAVEATAQAAALAAATAGGAWDAAVAMAGSPAPGGPPPAVALRCVAEAAEASGRPCLAVDVRALAEAREGGGAQAQPARSLTWGGGGPAAPPPPPPVDAGFLAWPPGASLTLVEDADGLQAAREGLLGVADGRDAGATVPIGLDLEWDATPGHEVGGGGGGGGGGASASASPSRPLVSTLQLASPTSCFVFDLAACEAAGLTARLAALVAALLASPRHLVLGVGLRADLARLGAALPAATAGGAIRCADAGKLGGGGGGGGGNGKASAPPGLAALAERALGSPLDKALRTSAWSFRPLTPAQVRYAGLDALVPALAWEKAGGAGMEEWEWRRQ